MAQHEMAQAHAEAIANAHFYELLGLRSRLVEEVAVHARNLVRCRESEFDASAGVALETLSLYVVRLDAVERRIAELAPNMIFDRKGEPCITAQKK